MASLTDEQRTTVESLFRMNDFHSMYQIIDQEYKTLGFQDKLTDAERIKEYQYITQQLRKYIAGRHEPIMSCGSNLDAMLATVESWITNAPEYGSERKELVYNFLRDSWILEVYNGLRYLIDEAENDYEDEEDE